MLSTVESFHCIYARVTTLQLFCIDFYIDDQFLNTIGYIHKYVRAIILPIAAGTFMILLCSRRTE